jgi:hypothetical protein
MNSLEVHMIATHSLFNEINASRYLAQKSAIEDNLLARKLGILVAIKTEKYANFKGEFVELTQHQLRALTHIFIEYFNFNANIEERLPQLILSHQQCVSLQSLQCPFTNERVNVGRYWRPSARAVIDRRSYAVDFTA